MSKTTLIDGAVKGHDKFTNTIEENTIYTIFLSI